MIKLILVEDDLSIQKALVTFIQAQPEFELLSAYASAMEFNQSPPKEMPNVCILDINLPEISGIELIPTIKGLFPDTNILMLSVNNDNESVFKSLQAGADGYLGKETQLDKIKDAILDLNQGGSPITPAIARKVFDYFNAQQQVLEELSERESQVVRGILNGLSYKLVAAELNLSIDTVRKYIKSIYRKLHINSKGELMAKYNKL